MTLLQFFSTIGVLIVTPLLLGLGSTASAAPGPANASAVVNDFLPGATATIQSAPSTSNSSAEVLAIQLPSSAIPSGQTGLQLQFVYHEIGWKARVAASLVAQGDANVTSYTVTTASGNVPTGAFNDFHGGFATIGAAIGEPELDSVAPTLAMKQLQSNLSALQGAMPPGSVTQAVATMVPSSPSGDQYVLEADVTIDQASSLVGFYGDVLQGLQTGLTGDPSSAVIEGLAIVVTTPDGTPVVGSWQATRSLSGVLQFADPSQASESLQVTTEFPNLTGGPSTAVGALGSGVRTSTGQAGGSAIASASSDGHNGAKAVPSQVHVLHGAGKQGSGLGAWWAAIGAAAAVAIALITLGGRRRHHLRHRHA